MILTTECVISDIPEENAGAGHMPGGMPGAGGMPDFGAAGGAGDCGWIALGSLGLARWPVGSGTLLSLALVASASAFTGVAPAPATSRLSLSRVARAPAAAMQTPRNRARAPPGQDIQQRRW